VNKISAVMIPAAKRIVRTPSPAETSRERRMGRTSVKRIATNAAPHGCRVLLHPFSAKPCGDLRSPLHDLSAGPTATPSDGDLPASRPGWHGARYHV